MEWETVWKDPDLPFYIDNTEETKKKRPKKKGKKGKNAEGKYGTLGLPLALGMYELAPLWVEIFTRLGFRVLLSDFSTRATYLRGQSSIPSDTACYPAKIMHGHMVDLMEAGADAIFYPCLSYNIDEKHTVIFNKLRSL